MPGAHAILSPSGASRWMACTPSARLEEKFPESTSTYAEEGTLAHAVAELILLDEPDFREKLEKLKNSKLGKQYYSDALYGYADEYADYVRGHVTKGAMLFVEQKLDLTKYVPEAFGTGDALILKDGVLTLCDLKYGQGVPVYAENNKQLMLYALGALDDFDMLYEIDTVSLHIFQPRIDNISSWEISVEELRAWADKEVVPKAKLAWEGKGDFVPGEHCRFCKVSAQCRALADHHLEIARHEFFGEDPAATDTELLSLAEIADILERGEHIQLWLNLLKQYAFDRAMAGEKVPGFKLVEGRSNRKYSDENVVKAELLAAGFNEEAIMTKPTLLGITALEKAIKKAAFKDIVEPHLEKPPGSPTLVKEDDKRPEWSAATSDFKDLLNNG